MPRTSRLAVGGPAGETTDFDADHKFSPLERMLLTAAVCTEMPAPTPHMITVDYSRGQIWRDLEEYIQIDPLTITHKKTPT